MFCNLLIFSVCCGEKGIRTPETLLMFTRFPGGPVQPLLHLSENAPKSTQYFPILQMTAVFSPFGIRVSAPFRSGGVLPSAPFAARLPSPEGTGSLPIPGKRKTGRPADLPFSRRREAASLDWLTPVSTDYVLYRLERIAEQIPHVRPVSFSFWKQTSSEPVFRWQAIVFRCRLLSCLLAGRRNKDSAVEKRMQRCRFSQRIGRIWVSDFMAKYSA